VVIGLLAFGGGDRGGFERGKPVHRSRYVKTCEEKRTAVTRPSVAEQPPQVNVGKPLITPSQ
jgi:hypothetical protein